MLSRIYMLKCRTFKNRVILSSLCSRHDTRCTDVHGAGEEKARTFLPYA